jgi:hypothetical protein
VEYLLPREINVRRVYADNSATAVTFRAGKLPQGSIVKLQPLNSAGAVRWVERSETHPGFTNGAVDDGFRCAQPILRSLAVCVGISAQKSGLFATGMR